MATYYAVAAANWNVASTWASTSGGAAGAGVPTNADDVYLDANSPGNVAASNVTCRSLDLTGFTHTLNGGGDLTLGGSTARSDNVIFNGGTATMSGFALVLVNSSAASAQSVTLPAAGVTASFTFQGTATYNTTAAFKLNSNGVFQVGGTATFNTNGFAITSGQMNIEGTGTGINLGASAVTCTGFAMVGTATCNAGTSTITVTGTAGVTAPTASALTLNNVVLTSNGSATTVSGPITFANLSYTPGARVNTFPTSLSFGSSVTVTGLLTLTANAVLSRCLVQSATLGTPHTITAGSVSLSYVDFVDIVAAGASAPWGGTDLGDGGDNSNITFPAGRVMYLRGGASAWNGTSAWSLASGGAPVATGSLFPLIQDTATIDNNSVVANVTLSVNVPRTGTIDMSGYTNATFTFTLGNSSFTPSICGSLLVAAGQTHVTWGFAGTVTFAGRGSGSYTITTQSMTVASAIGIQAPPTGTYTLGSALVQGSATNNLYLVGGIFQTNNYSITTGYFNLDSGCVVLGGTTTVTLPGTNGISSDGGNHTGTNIASMTFNFTYAGASSIGFNIGFPTLNYGTWNFPGGAGVGPIALPIVHITAISIGPSTSGVTRVVTCPAGGTITLTGGGAAWNVTGTVGNLISLTSGSPWTLSVASGTVSSNYLSLTNSHASGGATFYAGGNSTNTSGNTGWLFSDAPTLQTFALTQAALLSVQHTSSRTLSATQSQTCSTGPQAQARTFGLVQAANLSTQRAISVSTSAGQAVSASFGAQGTTRTVSTAQAPSSATVSVRVSRTLSAQQSAAPSYGITANNINLQGTFTATQAQGVSVTATEDVHATFTVAQNQTAGALAVALQRGRLTLGQASVVFVGFGARLFTATQTANATTQLAVAATLSATQAQYAKVLLPIHKGSLAVSQGTLSVGVTTTAPSPISVTTGVARITVEVS